MTVETIFALTCPACGGPVTRHAARNCTFCGVALLIPRSGGEPFTMSEPVAIHLEIARLRERLRDDPTQAETHRRLGWAYDALGLADDAVRSLTVAVGLMPEDVPARLELATLLARRSAAGMPDAFPAAMRHVRQVLALAPGSTGGHLLLARLLTQRGQYDAARSVLTGLDGLAPEEHRLRAAWVTLAEAADHERRGNGRDAVAAWRRAAADSPALVEPAVAAFLARSRPSMAPNAGPGQRAVEAVRRWRAPLVAVLVLLVGPALGLPWAVLGSIVALPVLLMLPGLVASWTARATRSGVGDLGRLLAEAEVAAARSDQIARRRRVDWSDNLALPLPGQR